MLATLADLLAPATISEFLDVFRARKRFHVPASDRTRAESLLSWRDIDILLSERALDTDVTLQRDGVLIPRQLYTSNKGKQLSVSALHDLLSQGVSIIVVDVHRSVPNIRQLAAAVEREMRIRTFVNAYLSFSKGGAFKPHWDNEDVLIVQVHGTKRWRVWNAEVLNPIGPFDASIVDASVAPDEEFEMSAGDILFIPRGEPHSAAVSTKHSVHLTIGLFAHTGISFFDHLRTEAVKDPILRMNLPLHSSDGRSAHEAVLKQRLHQLIDAASMSQFLLQDDLSRSPASQTAAARELPRMEDILRLTLRRRIPLPDVAPDAGAQTVTIGGETRRLLPVSIDVLRWLFDHDPATVRSLHAEMTPRHGKASTEAAIGEMLRLGFLFVNYPVSSRL